MFSNFIWEETLHKLCQEDTVYTRFHHSVNGVVNVTLKIWYHEGDGRMGRWQRGIYNAHTGSIYTGRGYIHIYMYMCIYIHRAIHTHTYIHIYVGNVLQQKPRWGCAFRQRSPIGTWRMGGFSWAPLALGSTPTCPANAGGSHGDPCWLGVEALRAEDGVTGRGRVEDMHSGRNDLWWHRYIILLY